jgi:hypothetical protein
MSLSTEAVSEGGKTITVTSRGEQMSSMLPVLLFLI